jgi:hypothetical protein
MGEFTMFDLNPQSNLFEPVISSKIKDLDVVLEYNYKIRPIFWKDFNSGTFSDSPKCGYNRAKCPVKRNLDMLIYLENIDKTINIFRAVSFLGLVTDYYGNNNDYNDNYWNNSLQVYYK